MPISFSCEYRKDPEHSVCWRKYTVGPSFGSLSAQVHLRGQTWTKAVPRCSAIGLEKRRSFAARVCSHSVQERIRVRIRLGKPTHAC